MLGVWVSDYFKDSKPWNLQLIVFARHVLPGALKPDPKTLIKTLDLDPSDSAFSKPKAL